MPNIAELLFLFGLGLALIASHLIAKAVERRLAGIKRKWLAKLLPLVVLLASFAAIASAFGVIISYSRVGADFGR